MAYSKGRAGVDRYFDQARDRIRPLLRGAARAGATVIADRAKENTQSSEVRAAVKIATRQEETRMVGLVQLKGPGAYLAPWEEYGTSAHFISVDESQRGGRSIGRINRLAKEPDSSHSLVIGGAFVGTTVLHPGARPHPFLRPALDTEEVEAQRAAQSYINARVSRRGIAAESEDGA